MTETNHSAQAQLAALQASARETRLTFYRTLGEVSEPNAFPDDEERWSVGVPWRTITLGDFTWFVTDGLSDPRGVEPLQPSASHATELFIEMPTHLTLAPLMGTRWAVEALMKAARFVSLRPLPRGATCAVSLEPQRLPDDCTDFTAGAIALVGLTFHEASTDFELAAGPACLRPVTLLSAGETVLVRESSNQEAWAHDLIQRFHAQLDRDVRGTPAWRKRVWDRTGGDALPARVPFTPTEEFEEPPFENQIHDWLNKERAVAKSRVTESLKGRS
ncbi:hypothetical protein A176_004862 [Myxococcus hansupus]|uniref:Suppressor of fused-like domain-containing protein n=1 Tax=Pseudomyxococcus hansupus TaxID=1297742 RepID=A0A0H4X2S7_9BACT|nr:hypothetical protein [Myxococcus hansupus]AKQ67950.1 hypothetical protein A176_004862 [Myxococcus hansupus]